MDSDHWGSCGSRAMRVLEWRLMRPDACSLRPTITMGSAGDRGTRPTRTALTATWCGSWVPDGELSAPAVDWRGRLQPIERRRDAPDVGPLTGFRRDGERGRGRS